MLRLINLISSSWRFNLKREVPPSPSIILFWHGLMLPGWKFFERRKANALVSMSQDGEILTHLLTLWGFNVVRGSSSSHGKEALEQLIELAPKGYLLITPDGPKGPPFVMKAGALITSLRTQVPIYLCGINIRKKITFNKSWDLFQFPLPFSEIELNFEGPYLLQSDASREEISEFLEKLNAKLLFLDNTN